MRSAIDAPTEVFSPEVAGRMRAFLDRQRPIELAVWVRHEQHGVEGPLYDHHTMLGVDDERYSAADLPALEQGIGLECPGIPGWLDLFPLSEVEGLCDFGEVLWERSDELGELDPLDFRFTHEPIAVTPEARSVFVELVREAAPAVVLVYASHARFWKGDRGSVGELASRLAGSSDLYESGGRSPHASLNFITAHDGFTLRDLVSYERKHNEANGEGNRDGNDHNDSWNCGAEGPSADPAITQLRARQQRNLLVTLLLSQGVPMLLAGDEHGQTQQGNNNAYCQDSPLAWIDWKLDAERQALLAFVRKVIALRRSEPVFRRRRFFCGRPIHGADVKDLYWIKPDGSEMSDADWRSEARVLGMALPGDQIPELDERGLPIRGKTFALLFNGQSDPVPFRIGARDRPLRWTCVIDTADPDAPPIDFAHGSLLLLQGRSVVVLRASYGA